MSTLVHKWNRNVADFNSMVRPRNVGRPLRARDAQRQAVLKMRKAGKLQRAVRGNRPLPEHRPDHRRSARPHQHEIP
jgi:hypothetical protein